MAISDPGRLVVKHSPTPELTLTVFQPLEYPEFVPMLREVPSLHGAAGLSAVLTNVSPHRVTAVVAHWNYLDYRTTPRGKYVVLDNYSSLDARKPLGPGGRLLVTLSGLSPPFDVTRPHAVVWSGNNLVHGASGFTVGIDSAVFENARIAGADTFHIADYIHGRYAAMQWLAEQVMVAEAAGENVSAVLAAIKRSEAVNEEQRWRRRLASLASRHPATAKSWLYLPKPPQFFRSH